ncbi:MAG: 5-(carboxyamino)imidazole ribonucleotide mutase [Zetaproteobacteria bacterium]|nr:MAG: 5-(carboxyamino)imidazole ribonucleotide mutase [Zetaproteobacteria bacterium]
MSNAAIKVLILTGSKSDLPVVEQAQAVLRDFGVPCRLLVRSAHRTPEETVAAVRAAEEEGCQLFICAAGMAAHLAGVVAAHTIKPVIGLPIASGSLRGEDALLSTVMMPPGMPVATVAINGARNAALLALQILALHDDELAERYRRMRRKAAEAILAD